jgi:hypothetical protein
MQRSLFVTGNVGALRALRALAPEARIGLTWTGPDRPPPLFQELGAEFWNPEFHWSHPSGSPPCTHSD